MSYLKYVKAGILICVGLGVGAAAWAAGIEPRLVYLSRRDAEIPNLPEPWEGERMAMIADIQVGMRFANTDTARRMVRRIISERPSIVLLGGDFLYLPGNRYHECIATVLDILRPLTDCKLRTFAVLGNHDYAMFSEESAVNRFLAAELRRSLESIDIKVLNNEDIQLYPTDVDRHDPADVLHLIGLGEARANDDSPGDLFERIGSATPRIVVMHNPRTFGKLAPGTAPFAVAAHTHGGQVRIPFTPNWVWRRIHGPHESHARGWVTGMGQTGNNLYINQGTGFSMLPIRFNCIPELTLFTLHRPEQDPATR